VQIDVLVGIKIVGIKTNSLPITLPIGPKKTCAGVIGRQGENFYGGENVIALSGKVGKPLKKFTRIWTACSFFGPFLLVCQKGV
jgi:hypothetical protein